MIRSYRPVTPGRRFASVVDFSALTRARPEKSLVVPRPGSGGRNCYGHVTSRHRGAGHKRMYRLIDFRRDKDGVPARVAAIEYDPNRSAFVALLHYADGEKRYILCPDGLKVDDTVMSGESAEPKVGNCMPLKSIPLGLTVHNVELKKGHGGELVRSAGCAATLLTREGRYAHVLLPSKEIRRVFEDCRATIGQISNPDHVNVTIGKAGRSRWMGRRPKVRGVAQNPVSHPMGGGEGKSSGGRHPCSPWGKPSKGGKTRKRGKLSDAYIVRPRKRGRRHQSSNIGYY